MRGNTRDISVFKKGNGTPFDPHRSELRHFGWAFVGILLLVASACTSSGQPSADNPVPPVTYNCPPDRTDQCTASFGDPASITAKRPPVDPTAPLVVRYVPKAYYGDAPFATELVFEVNSPTGAKLRCEFDSEGDGFFELQPDCTIGVLPVSYAVPGRYAPTLRVSDSAGKVTTVTEFLASNRLIPKPNTVKVDELPGLVGNNVVGDTVTLSFTADGQVPPLADWSTAQSFVSSGRWGSGARSGREGRRANSLPPSSALDVPASWPAQPIRSIEPLALPVSITTRTVSPSSSLPSGPPASTARS